MLPPPWPRCRFLSVSRTHRDPLPIPPGAAGSGPGSPLGSPRLPLPGPAPCAVFPRLPPRCCQPNKSPLGAFWFLLFCFSPLPFKSHGNTSGGCSSAATGIAPCTAAPPPDPKSLGGEPRPRAPMGAFSTAPGCAQLFGLSKQLSPLGAVTPKGWGPWGAGCCCWGCAGGVLCGVLLPFVGKGCAAGWKRSCLGGRGATRRACSRSRQRGEQSRGRKRTREMRCGRIQPRGRVPPCWQGEAAASRAVPRCL